MQINAKNTVQWFHTWGLTPVGDTIAQGNLNLVCSEIVKISVYYLYKNPSKKAQISQFFFPFQLNVDKYYFYYFDKEIKVEHDFGRMGLMGGLSSAIKKGGL